MTQHFLQSTSTMRAIQDVRPTDPKKVEAIVKFLNQLPRLGFDVPFLGWVRHLCATYDVTHTFADLFGDVTAADGILAFAKYTDNLLVDFANSEYGYSFASVMDGEPFKMTMAYAIRYLSYYVVHNPKHPENEHGFGPYTVWTGGILNLLYNIDLETISWERDRPETRQIRVFNLFNLETLPDIYAVYVLNQVTQGCYFAKYVPKQKFWQDKPKTLRTDRQNDQLNWDWLRAVNGEVDLENSNSDTWPKFQTIANS